MVVTSSPDPAIRPSESGTLPLVPQLAILSRGTLTGCGPLPTLPMGATSSPDPTIAPFVSGMPRLVPQSAILSRGILTRSRLLLTLRTGSTSFLGLVTTLPVCGTHFLMNFLHSPTWMGGSGTQGVVYYIGCPMIVVQACIHLPL